MSFDGARDEVIRFTLGDGSVYEGRIREINVSPEYASFDIAGGTPIKSIVGSEATLRISCLKQIAPESDEPQQVEAPKTERLKDDNWGRY